MPTDSQLQKALLRTDLRRFIERVFRTVSPNDIYMHNWHVSLIAEYLEAVRRGDIKRLIINIPPRYMKSISCTVAFPAWILAQNPRDQIMAASYSMSLARKHSIDTRFVMESDWYKHIFPKTIINEDENNNRKFTTTERGYRMATSVGSSLTGEGANYIIVDDALNAVDARSKTKRDAANEWFSQSLVTRLNSKKNDKVIVIMQRLHEEDLAGYLLQKDDAYTLLKLPVIFPEKKIYSFGKVTKTVEAGELLHEERENLITLTALESEMGALAFAGQYRQEPATEGGSIIKEAWLKYYNIKENIGMPECFQSWDTAIKEGQENDWSVCTTWKVKQNQFYVADLFRAKLNYPDLKKAVISQAQHHNPNIILVEDKSSGQQILQELKLDTALNFVGIKPVLDKEARLRLASVYFETGRVHLPNNVECSDWVQSMIYEFKMFPNSTNDDIVDSVSQFLNWYAGRPQYNIRRL